MSGTDLATRCPACKTVFRVVPDQLKVSAGWVRCGRCAEVFNAHEALVEATVVTTQAMPDDVHEGPPTFPPTEMAYDTAPQAAPERLPGAGFNFDPPGAERAAFSDANAAPLGTPTGELEIATQAAQPEPAEPGSGWAFGPLTPQAPPQQPASEPAPAAPSAADLAAAQGLLTRRAPRPSTSTAEQIGANASGAAPQSDPAPAPTVASMASMASMASIAITTEATSQAAVGPKLGPGVAEPPRDARAVEGAIADAETSAPSAPTTRAKKNEARATATDSAPAPFALDPVAPMPSFVRNANRAARWHSPLVRGALLLGCALAALVLAAQAGYQYRDDLAARWPAAKPTLQSACIALGCEIQPPRSIDGLVIESIALSPLNKSADLHELTVALRNQRRHEVALPALELTLTDPQGRLVARKVLLPNELGGGDKAAVTALGEATLQGTLSLALGSVAGSSWGYTIATFYP
jgi:predicted Zn finger-like uncharacterized protein